MGNWVGARGALIGALVSMCVVAPAQAQRCWRQPLVEAAQVKEFDIMLMVATLRCQTRGLDLSANYNSFVSTHRPILKGVGDEIIRELNTTLGGREALKTYDRMGVTMANKYGQGVEGLECTDFQAIIIEAQTTPSSRAALLVLAQRAGMEPPLPAPRCDAPAVAGAVAPVAAVATVAATAAPVAAPAP